MIPTKTVIRKLTNEVSTKSLVTGIYCGLVCVLLSVSYASLIFSGKLSDFISIGINIALTSVIIAGIITVVATSFNQTLLQIDDDTAPVFALLISSVTTTMVNPDSTSILSLIILTVFSATLILGITLFAVAYFNIGRFIQYLPYSVMGGYFAAVGWLLCIGSFTVATGLEISTFSAIIETFSVNNIANWLPMLVIGFWLHKMRSRISETTLLGGTIVFSIALFFIAHYTFNGQTPNELMQQGVLIGPFKTDEMQLTHLIRTSQIDWGQIGAFTSNLGTIASLLLISLLSIILCVSGLGLYTMRDIDLNHELKVAGAANIASATFGGMSALPSLTISQLSLDLYPKNSRIVSITALVFCVVCFYFALDFVAYIHINVAC